MVNGRVSPEEIRRIYGICVENTESLKETDETFIGFIVGFRAYERMATALRRNLTDDESRRFVQVGSLKDEKCTE